MAASFLYSYVSIIIFLSWGFHFCLATLIVCLGLVPCMCQQQVSGNMEGCRHGCTNPQYHISSVDCHGAHNVATLGVLTETAERVWSTSSYTMGNTSESHAQTSHYSYLTWFEQIIDYQNIKKNVKTTHTWVFLSTNLDSLLICFMCHRNIKIKKLMPKEK